MTDDLTLDDLPQPVEETTVSTERLSVDGDNPNEQPDEMFGLLCENMRTCGWLGNAIVCDADYVIADGEHRWRAAQEIGLEEVPVKVYDIDEPTRRLWRQELNKISGEHDRKRDALEYDLLLNEGKSDEVHDLTNAAGEDLDELLAEIRLETDKRPQYEYDPEHNVYFEDCVEGMRERVADDSVDCVITDPPYGIEFQSNWGSDFDTLEGDSELASSVQVYREMCAQATRALCKDGHFYAFTRWDIYPQFLSATAEFFDVKNCLVWHKPKGGMGDLQGNYVPNHEFIIFASNGGSRKLNDGRPKNVITHNPPPPEDYTHPTEKPLDLIADLLANSTQEGDTVLDPFMGSGTTAVAAIQNDRDYVGFEIDAENYRPVIERRIGEAKRQVAAQEASADD